MHWTDITPMSFMSIRKTYPPPEAFWSLSLFDNDGFPTANPLNRYAVSSWMPLTYNSDGSLDIRIRSEAPKLRKKQAGCLL
ncbi:DUF1214 domain-containing protein [Falsihalocynthiibacter sp. CO-5D18]|uniref:DUF1214 domain-containing protein n=2 Tax=Roseobacteraceae TaxID=2854170 RepID=UPI00350EBFC9